MPSTTHQNFLLLFRDHPELVFELARRAGAPLPAQFERFEELTPEFDNPLATNQTVTADLVVVGLVDDQPHRALVLEVQLARDLRKQWTVVLYRAGLRHRLCCPAWAIVFSPDPAVRATFVDPMFTDEPELRPLIVTPEMTPVLPSLAAAIADYPAAVLAAAMHANGPHAVFSATIAIQALLQVAPREQGRYIQLVSASVGKQVMQQVREQLPPEKRIELSEWERRGASFVMGLEEGREQGLEQGLRGALRTVLETRGLVLDQALQDRVDACSEVTELRHLIARATTVTSAAELFGTDA